MQKQIKKLGFLLFSLVVITLNSCGSSQKSTSYLESAVYDDETDVTSYMKLPLGKVDLPGKWEKGAYYEVARQQMFTNAERDAAIMIALVPCKGFEFDPDGKLKGNDFIDAYYKWESEYFVSDGFECKVIEANADKHYKICRFAKGENIENYFFFGERDGVFHNYSIASSKMTEGEKVLFLKNMWR